MTPKITAEQARKIFKDPRSSTILAQEYGIAASTIRSIHTRRAWIKATEDLPRTPRPRGRPRHQSPIHA